MALDEPNHRLFVGYHEPAQLVTLNTMTGESLAEVKSSGDIDDMFYDANLKRLYLSCGQGFIDVIDQLRLIATGQRRGSRPAPEHGSFFSPGINLLYLAVHLCQNEQAEVQAYQPQQ